MAGRDPRPPLPGDPRHRSRRPAAGTGLQGPPRRGGRGEGRQGRSREGGRTWRRSASASRRRTTSRRWPSPRTRRSRKATGNGSPSTTAAAWSSTSSSPERKPSEASRPGCRRRQAELAALYPRLPHAPRFRSHPARRRNDRTLQQKIDPPRPRTWRDRPGPDARTGHSLDHAACRPRDGAGGTFVVWSRSRRTTDYITRNGLARTFQNIRLFPEMLVIENVLMGMDARRTTPAWSDRVSHAGASERGIRREGEGPCAP